MPLPPRIYLSLSLSSISRDLFPSLGIRIHLCPSLSLVSLDAPSSFSASLLISFPSTSLRANRTIQSVADCKNKWRSRALFSSSHSSPLRSQKRAESMCRCSGEAPFYFRTHENRRLYFWTFAGWCSSIRALIYLKSRTRNLYYLDHFGVWKSQFKMSIWNNFLWNFLLEFYF